MEQYVQCTGTERTEVAFSSRKEEKARGDGVQAPSLGGGVDGPDTAKPEGDLGAASVWFVGSCRKRPLYIRARG